MKNDHLWELIKKISPTEKAYFKKQSNVHSNNSEFIYLKLFDELNAIQKYDANKIALVYDSYHQSSRLKNYLYELILSSLDSYASSNDTKLQSKKMLSYAKILYSKGLIYKSNQVAEKCLELASNNFDYYLQLEVTSFQKTLKITELISEEVSNLIEKEKEIFEKINEINQYELLLSKISTFSFKKGHLISIKEKKIIVSYFNNRLLRDKIKFKSIVAKSLYHRILTLCYLMNNDTLNAYKNALLRFESIKDTTYIISDLQNYINTLNNLIWLCIETKRFKEAEEFKTILFGIKTNTPFFEARVKARYIVSDLRLILVSKSNFDYKQVNAIALDCLQYQDNLIRMDEKLEILFFIITLCFNNKKYKETKLWLGIYFKQPKTDIRLDLQCFLLLINIYTHYITKDFEHARYLMKNTSITLTEKGMMNSQEKIIYDFIQNDLSEKRNKKELDEGIISIRNKLALLNDDPNNISLAKYIMYPLN